MQSHGAGAAAAVAGEVGERAQLMQTALGPWVHLPANLGVSPGLRPEQWVHLLVGGCWHCGVRATGAGVAMAGFCMVAMAGATVAVLQRYKRSPCLSCKEEREAPGLADNSFV